MDTQQEAINALQKLIQEHKDTVDEDFDYYRYELNGDAEHNKDKKTSELVDLADIDSPDFNIGFEQGMMRGYEYALSVITKLKL